MLNQMFEKHPISNQQVQKFPYDLYSHQAPLNSGRKQFEKEHMRLVSKHWYNFKNPLIQMVVNV